MDTRAPVKVGDRFTIRAKEGGQSAPAECVAVGPGGDFIVDSFDEQGRPYSGSWGTFPRRFVGMDCSAFGDRFTLTRA